jgi:hypothetical protein
MLVSAYPLNAQAKKIGFFQTKYDDYLQARADFGFVIGGESFQGEAVTAMGGSSSWGAIYSQGVAYASGTGGYASGSYAGASRYNGSTINNSDRGRAIAQGSKGSLVQCEYEVTHESMSATGYCKHSNGGYFQIMMKPINIIMSDGTRRMR